MVEDAVGEDRFGEDAEGLGGVFRDEGGAVVVAAERVGGVVGDHHVDALGGELAASLLG
ncbi:MAG: hypothetical protein R3B70_13055 [Polyangiaceae bacterium]